MSIDEIIKLRNQLPDDWIWRKCYELGYINTRTGDEFIQKHWALTVVDGKGPVFSLGLISHDSISSQKEFFKGDIPVLWVEKSLTIVDCLIAEINRLKSLS
ncbi:MAG: hypothetical protein M9904_02230 [Chitinophagaceae bacterium]|nr:hypothetical protein [Chitinophagaceae bacterium]